MAPLLRGKRALAPDLPLLERLTVLRGVPAGGVSVDSRLKKVPFRGDLCGLWKERQQDDHAVHCESETVIFSSQRSRWR